MDFGVVNHIEVIQGSKDKDAAHKQWGKERNRGVMERHSVMFRDGNLDFEAYGYHMDNIWIYGYWMILSEISASFAP